MELFVFDVDFDSCSLCFCTKGFSMSCSRRALHMCSAVSNAFFETSSCDPESLVPFGGSLSELLECVQMVRRAVAGLKPAWSTDWLATGVGCRHLKSGLKSLYSVGVGQVG